MHANKFSMQSSKNNNIKLKILIYWTVLYCMYCNLYYLNSIQLYCTLHVFFPSSTVCAVLLVQVFFSSCTAFTTVLLEHILFSLYSLYCTVNMGFLHFMYSWPYSCFWPFNSWNTKYFTYQCLLFFLNYDNFVQQLFNLSTVYRVSGEKDVFSVYISNNLRFSDLPNYRTPFTWSCCVIFKNCLMNRKSAIACAAFYTRK